jgi:hypothetical protein
MSISNSLHLQAAATIATRPENVGLLASTERAFYDTVIVDTLSPVDKSVALNAYGAVMVAAALYFSPTPELRAHVDAVVSRVAEALLAAHLIPPLSSDEINHLKG